MTMTDKTLWEDPPDAKGQTGRYVEFLSACRTKPGTWAKFPAPVNNSNAGNIRRGLTKGSAPAGSFDATTRAQADPNVGGPGDSWLYVRFIGEPS